MLEQGFSGICGYGAGDFVVRPPYSLHANEVGGDRAIFIRLAVSSERWRTLRRRLGWRPINGSAAMSAGECSAALVYKFGGDFLLDRVELGQQEPGVQVDAMGDAAEKIADGRAPISAIAEDMNLPPYEFARRFRRAQRLSPTEYRRNARIQRGMKMLAETDEKLSIIAQDAGFFDQSHFSKELKRVTGLSPGDFRRWASKY